MYSEDLRARVIFLKHGLRLRVPDISLVLNISTSTVYRIIKKFLLSGELSCEKVGRPVGASLHQYEQYVLMEAILGNPAMTLREIQCEIERATGGSYHLSTVWRYLKWSGMTRKKLRKVALQRNEALRAAYRAEICLHAPEMLVFIDESGFDERLQRQYGYAFRGLRATVFRYFVRTPRVSTIAAMSLDGLICLRCVNGTVNGNSFLDFVNQDLAPILLPYNGINPNSVVVMDNAAIHHVQAVQNAIRRTGARLIYLPPYSPDMNPLEEGFNQVKDWIKSNDIVWAALQGIPKIAMLHEAFYQLTSDDCYGYFRHAEYAY